MTDGTETPAGATVEGTQAFAARFEAGGGRYKAVNDLHWSSVGIGTYLGGADEATDTLVADAVADAIRGGINVIDTAANYRRGRGEIAAGAGIKRALAAGDAERAHLIVCTKAGYLPTPADEFLETYVGKWGITENDLVAGNHCLHPAYIEDRIERSLTALGLTSIDVFYLHNPEAQLAHVDRKTFDSRLAGAFEVLEAACSAGRVGCYGLATWRAFRLSPGEPGYVSLAGVKALAKNAAGGKPDGFKCVQMPLSLKLPEAVNRPTQWIGDASVSAIAAARLLGMAAIASGSIAQGKTGPLNESMKAWLGADFETDAERALQFTRSATGLTTALVGMKQPDNVRRNLAVQTADALPRASFELMFRKAAV